MTTELNSRVARPRSGWTRATELLPWAALLAVIALQRLWAMDVSPWIIVVALGAMFVTGVIRARGELRSRRSVGMLVVLLVVSALFVILSFLTEPGERATNVALSRLVPALVGWSLLLWLPGIGARGEDDGPAWRWLRAPPLALKLGLLVAYLVSTVLMLYWAADFYAVLQDEALYMVQAGLLGHEGFGWRMPAEHIPFFRPEYVLYRDGVLTTQYAPGWPAGLALFDAVGLRWLSNPLLATITVGCVFWIAQHVYSPLAGWIAALIVATQEWFILDATGYMPHIFTAAMLAMATVALMAAERRERRSQLVLRVLAGLLLGIAVVARPLTGVAIGASIGIWMIARQGWGAKELFRLGAPVVAGLAVPAVFVLYYNSVTTGDPLLFGYKAVHGPLHDLGFGVRGFRYFHAGLVPTEVVSPFLLGEAFAHFRARSWQFALELLPLFLLIPVIWLGVARGARIRWILVAAFALLPLGQFFWFSSRMRFYTELVPFTAIGVALLVAHVAERDWRRTGGALVLVLALLAVMRLPTVTRSGDAVWKRVAASAKQLEEAHAREGDLLVFVEEAQPESYLFRRLWQFNTEGYDSPILVARSQGVRDLDLAKRFPNRTAMRATWRGVERPIGLEPLR